MSIIPLLSQICPQHMRSIFLGKMTSYPALLISEHISSTTVFLTGDPFATPIV